MPSLPFTGSFQIEQHCKQTAGNFLNKFFNLQKYDLIKAIEELASWTAEDRELHAAKLDLLYQINILDVSISGAGFFTLDRHLMTGVRFTPFELSVGWNFNRYFLDYSWAPFVSSTLPCSLNFILNILSRTYGLFDGPLRSLRHKVGSSKCCVKCN